MRGRRGLLDRAGHGPVRRAPVRGAVFTGFEEDHLDHHGTLEHYWASKARLSEPGRASAGVVVVDEPWGRRLALGLLGDDATVRTVLDRAEAITAAVSAAGPGDVVLVVGRGHETRLQDTLDPRGAVHFDDAEVANAALLDEVSAQAS